MLNLAAAVRYCPSALIVLALITAPSAQASLLPVCSAPETNYPAYIQSQLSRITPNAHESNTASIAFIMAAAITAKYSVSVDAKQITAMLRQEMQGHPQITLLDIKRTFNQLGFATDGKKAERPEEVLGLTNQILIAQDQQQNYMALIAASETYVYLIYGVVNQQALICPIHKSKFMASYTTQKFLLIN